MTKAEKQSHKKANSTALRRVARRSGKAKTPTSFVPATVPKSPGRPKGVQNKLTQDFKAAIKYAAELAGDIRGEPYAQRALEGYCMHLAMNNETLFVALIKSIIPAEINLSARSVVEVTYTKREEVVAAAEREGLPTRIFPVRYGEQKTIEHQPLELSSVTTLEEVKRDET